MNWTSRVERGYVYFITTETELNKPFDQLIQTKIGFAINPERRIKQLQTGNVETLILYGKLKSKNYKELEKTLHKKFAAQRIRGEWFNLYRYEIDSLVLAFNFAGDFEIQTSESSEASETALGFHKSHEWDFIRIFPKNLYNAFGFISDLFQS